MKKGIEGTRPTHADDEKLAGREGSRRRLDAGARRETSSKRNAAVSRIDNPSALPMLANNDAHGSRNSGGLPDPSPLAATAIEPMAATLPSAVQRVTRKLARRARAKTDAIPRIGSFLEFLTKHARVKSGSSYVLYHFRGREALLPIVQQIDALLASGEPDASLALCGGAQFGKTVLMLNLLAYLVAVRFRNVGYYLPDDDLVSGIVDGKLRPDVLDQVPWLARLLQVGKTLSPTGRAVNRKGAFLCTDGSRSALAFMRGLGKIPTSFSMDVVVQDEKDDLPEEHARFLSGRMTASDLRLSLLIGTQRYHGAGQNLAFTEGTQHIGMLRCPGCARRVNPELAWPEVCRLRCESASAKDAPRLTAEGHFVWGSNAESPDANAVRSRRAPGDGVVIPQDLLSPANPSSKDETSEVAGAVPSPGATNGSGMSSSVAADRRAAEGASATGTVLRTDSGICEDLPPGQLHSAPFGRSAARRSAATEQSGLGDSQWNGDDLSAHQLRRPEVDGYRLHPIPYSPGQSYYLGCPDCGAELDRDHPEWHALAPDRAALRRWSYRLSQLLFPDIDLAQIVAAWQLAIRDPAQMNVFCTDRLALPRSSSQTLTPHDLATARGDYRLSAALPTSGRAKVAADVLIGGATNGSGMPSSVAADRRAAEGASATGTVLRTDSGICENPSPGQLHSAPVGRSAARRSAATEGGGSAADCIPVASLPPPMGTSAATARLCAHYGGLDLGDQCWFVARSVEIAPPHRARLLWIEPIAAERVRTRVPELFRALNLRALCVDAGPLRDLSRDLTFALNGLDEDSSATGDDAARNIFFSRNGSTLPLRWRASAERWENVRCIPVEFTQREAQGIRHKVARTQEGRVYPLLAAHRDETIARVISEVLADGGSRGGGMLIEGADGISSRASGPRFLLPTADDASRGVLDLYERHLLAGSRQERSADGRTLRFLDKCENHFLLATAYAALAELVAPLRDAAADAAPLRPMFRGLRSPGSRVRSRILRRIEG